jgi:hypothetical protein
LNAALVSEANWPALGLLAALATLVPSNGAAAEPSELPHAAREQATAPSSIATRDHHTLEAQAETYIQFFRRAMLPGPGGSVVTTDWASPLTQFLFVRARDVDSPWDRDSIDLEVSAWAELWPTSSRFERPFDGDLQTANVAYRRGPLAFRVGRQLVAGGAARFSRFDGASLSLVSPLGLRAMGYGGWVVLPRWDALVGYHRLGAAERELLMGRELSLSRDARWLAGGRLGWQGHGLSAAASFHEQRSEQGLDRRNLGFDMSLEVVDRAQLGGSALVELDQRRMAEARGWLELRPSTHLTATLEALRTKPGLLLSRQSVMSVFATSAYDEVGGLASFQPLSWLSLESSAFFQVYDSGRPGARSESAVRLELPGRRVARLAYARVVVAQNGYSMLRASLSSPLLRRLDGTLETYAYLYDQPVLGYRTSSLYSGTLSYELLEQLEMLWGASLFRSPYAKLDAQTTLRLSYDLDRSVRRAP